MPDDAKTQYPSGRRPFWILGHGIMLVAVICFAIGFAQSETASPDDWFAGFEMMGLSVLATGIGLIVYGLLGLAVLFEVIGSSRRGSRGRRYSTSTRSRSKPPAS